MAKGNSGMVASDPNNNWRVESDLSTLMQAEEIEKDPKRFAACKELAKKKLLDLASVASEKD